MDDDTTSQDATVLRCGPLHQMHISNLYPGMGEDQLRTFFSAYGEIDFVYEYADANGNQCAYVSFKKRKDLLNAVKGLKLMVSSSKLKIDFTNFCPPMTPPQTPTKDDQQTVSKNF